MPPRIPPTRRQIAKRLGRLLRVVRERHAAFTIEDLAERLECSTNYWGMVELGKRLPSIRFLKQLVGLIGLSEDELRRARVLRAASRADDEIIRAYLLAGVGVDPVRSLIVQARVSARDGPTRIPRATSRRHRGGKG